MIDRIQGSLRNKLGVLFLIISLVPLVAISSLTLLNLLPQLGDFSLQLVEAENSLRNDVVGQNLEGAAADLAIDIDEYLLERILELQRLTELNIIVASAIEGNQVSQEMELGQISNDPQAVQNALEGNLFIPIGSETFSELLDAMFQQTERPGTPFLEMILTDANGVNIIITRPVENIVHKDQSWWQAAAAPGGAGIGTTEVFSDPIELTPVIGIALPVTDPNTKEVLGVLRALVRLNDLQERITRQAASLAVDIKVFTDEGLLIVDTGLSSSPETILNPASNVVNGNYQPAINALSAGPGIDGAGFTLNETESGREIVGYAHLNGGEYYFTSPAQLPSFEGFKWGVTVAQPENRALAVLSELIQTRDEFQQLPGRLGILFGAVTVLVAIGVLISSILISGNITVPLISLSDMAKKVQGGNLSVKVDVHSQDEIGILEDAFNTMTVGLRERERERDIFGRVVTPDVREMLLSGKLELGGETRWVTVLFSDIRSFSTISEQLTPQDLIQMLNEYLTEMNQAILDWNGYLNNFIGDAIVAIFGAPLDQEDKEWRAVAAALTMQERLAKLNERRVARGEQPLRSGIGISTGYAVAGQIGSMERLIYTVIGDAVNVAARLETLTAQYPDNPILFNKATADAIMDRPEIKLKSLGTVQVKGRVEPVDIFTIENWDKPIVN